MGKKPVSIIITVEGIKRYYEDVLSYQINHMGQLFITFTDGSKQIIDKGSLSNHLEVFISAPGIKIHGLEVAKRF